MATATVRIPEEKRDILRIIAGIEKTEMKEILVELIDEYERHTELGDEDEAAATLAIIDAVLLGEPVEIDGDLYQTEVSGEVAQILSQARQAELAISSGAALISPAIEP